MLELLCPHYLDRLNAAARGCTKIDPNESWYSRFKELVCQIPGLRNAYQVLESDTETR